LIIPCYRIRKSGRKNKKEKAEYIYCIFYHILILESNHGKIFPKKTKITSINVITISAKKTSSIISSVRIGVLISIFTSHDKFQVMFYFFITSKKRSIAITSLNGIVKK